VLQYIDQFRDPELVEFIVNKIHQECPRQDLKFMEVCGGHTIAIFKYGIQKLIPDSIHLISGPGCPVCVTEIEFIDQALALAHLPDVIITTFGDMVRVPGSKTNLQKERGTGIDVRVCYSVMDALKIAKGNPQKEVVFLGIGFETTAPTVAAAIKTASAQDIKNFSVLSAHKTMPNAMQALLDSGEVGLNGFICPGHVSAITGIHIYDFIAEKYRIPCVVSGFEPLDILETILMLIRLVNEGKGEVENQYTRSVKENGNLKARAIMLEVFEESESNWRGLGIIPGSGLRIKKEYRDFDARHKFTIAQQPATEYPGCICGDILRGVKNPDDCALFAKVCHPEEPKGACMVSGEGTCATWFKYRR
jgi:hydrogenase expression/formation protein HypD